MRCINYKRKKYALKEQNNIECKEKKVSKNYKYSER